MIYLEVKIKFKDGEEKVYKCSDVPSIGETWTILCPMEDPLKRVFMASEGIEKIEYTYKVYEKITKKDKVLIERARKDICEGRMSSPKEIMKILDSPLKVGDTG